AADIGREERGGRVGPDQFESHWIDFKHTGSRPGVQTLPLERDWARLTVAAGATVVEHHEISGAGKAFGDEVRVMLPDDLANGAKLGGSAEIRADLPNHGSIAAD